MLDIIGDISLSFTSEQVVLLVLLAFSLHYGRLFFFQTISFVLFAVITNMALKTLFSIHLEPYLHHAGYAFPSGHMQFATTFYTWLALYSASASWIKRSFVALLLAGVGTGLVRYGYHSIDDVLAGLIVGLVLVLLYRYALRHYAKMLPWILLGSATISLLYIRTLDPSLHYLAIVKNYYLNLWILVILQKANERFHVFHKKRRVCNE
jgi:membrane-associated phospholipid phosphatase